MKIITQDSVNMIYESLSSRGETILFNMDYFKNNKIGTVLIGEPYPFALVKVVEPNYSEFKDKDLSIDNNKSRIIL